MAIQSRKGQYDKFDPGKLLPGEWAVVTQGDPNSGDGLSVYMCFKAGTVKRMATYEDMVENINQASGDAIQTQIQAAISSAITAAENAAKEASSSATAANTAKSNADTAASAANQAKTAADAAADRAIKAAQNIEGLVDNTRVTKIEEDISAIKEALKTVLAVK